MLRKAAVFVIGMALIMPLSAQYNRIGLNGLFFTSDTVVNETGAFAAAPIFIYEGAETVDLMSFLINANYGVYDNAEVVSAAAMSKSSTGKYYYYYQSTLNRAGRYEYEITPDDTSYDGHIYGTFDLV